MSSASAGDGEEVTVELFVRSLAPRESRQRLESIVRQLDALVTAGVVSRYRVIPTGAELPATRAAAITDVATALLDRVAVFREWARATGRSLDVTFERRTASSRITGEDHDVLVVPTVAMAEYVGDDLRFVAPCSEDEDHWTVLDRLETLASGEPLPDDDRLPRARTVLSVDTDDVTPGAGDVRETSGTGDVRETSGASDAREDVADSPSDGPDDRPTPGTGI